jgi:peptidoglycan/LPS O-acetylase OafA/YrhL
VTTPRALASSEPAPVQPKRAAPATEGSHTGSGRSAGLDLLRVIAALLVAVFHLRLVLGFDFGPLNPVIEGGDAGVYIFFALSGYLLYRPFLRGPVDLRGYAIKRAARILPGYFVALVALTALTGSPLPLEHPLAFLTISSSYDPPLRAFLGNAWTLSAEVLYYVALPVIASLVAGRELPRLVILGVAAVAVTMAFRLVQSPALEWMAGSFPFVLYAFIPGMLLAVVEREHPRFFRSLARPPALIGGVILILLETRFRGYPLALAAGIGTPLLIGWLRQHRVPNARLLAFLGGASYALYLWHKDLYYVYGAFGFVIAAAGAALSWAFIERPTLDWAHRSARGLARRGGSRKEVAHAAAS